MKKAREAQFNVAEKANAPFPLRLRTLMEKEQMKQKDLAALLNVTRQSINQYCLGLSTPDIDKLCKIATRFNVSADYLLGLSEVSSSDESLKTVCKATGLSEKSISHISDPDFSMEHNLLFEANQWEHFILQLEDYLSYLADFSAPENTLQIAKFELTQAFWNVLEEFDRKQVHRLCKKREQQRNANLQAEPEVIEIKKLYYQFCQENCVNMSISEYCDMIRKRILAEK